MIKSKLNMSKFESVDKTFSFKTANLIGISLMIPIFIIGIMLYYSIYSKGLYDCNYTYVFIGSILGLILHEFVHGFVWHLYCQEKWKSIKFGIDKKTLSPYANCTEVLPINSYRMGTIGPFLITGLLPYIIGLTLNNPTILFTSILLMCSACGDFIILFTILKEKRSSLVLDHPTLCGCIVYREKEEQ